MNVYIVVSGCYSDYTIEGVFLNERKAELYCAIHNKGLIDDYRIEKYEIIDDNIEGNENIIGYLYCKHSLQAEPEICTKKYFEKYYGNDPAYVYLKEKDQNKAKKIFEDRVAECEMQAITKSQIMDKIIDNKYKFKEMFHTDPEYLRINPNILRQISDMVSEWSETFPGLYVQHKTLAGLEIIEDDTIKLFAIMGNNTIECEED